MAGTTSFPASPDNFATTSPTNLGDDDSTGRAHDQRHDDVEAAMEAVEAYGISNIPHIGTDAPTNDALVWIDTNEDGVPTSVLPPHPMLLMGA